MSICQKIENAKCCVANFSNAYVKACTFGTSTMEMFYELILLNAYIRALERYECSCKSCDTCLTEDEVCFILNQIALKCEAFACGC
jgi:hypothetical protein